MKYGPIAKRYARALVKAVDNVDELQAIQAELGEFLTVVDESHDLRQLLFNPTFANQRPSVVRQLLDGSGCREVTLKFLLLIVQRHRVEALADIVEAVRLLLDEKTGTVRVQVTSAWEMDEEIYRELMDVLARITEKNIALERKVDGNVLGGFVARIGSQVYDGSLKSKLDRLRDDLAEA